MQEVPRSGAFGTRSSPKREAETRGDRVVVAASGFTSLWALTWLGTEALAVNAAVQGGFAVGSVMASSGLALLWWKTRTMKQLSTQAAPHEAAAEADAEVGHEHDDAHSGGATGKRNPKPAAVEPDKA